MIESLMQNKWLVGIGMPILGFLVGYILEIIVIKRLKALTKKTQWKWDEIFISSFHWMPMIWGVSLGLYGSVKVLELNSYYIYFSQKALAVIFIFTSTIIIARLISGAIKMINQHTKGVMPGTTLFTRTTNLIIYFIGGFIILQNLNIEITPLITALGVSGLAVALALQDTLGNLFSGIQIIATQQVRPGDYVQLNSGEQGYVTDIKSRNTTIRSFPDNNMIIVPNTTLVSSIVTNYNLPLKHMWIDLIVGVSYGSDLDRVEEVTLETAESVLETIQGGLTTSKPILRFEEFSDSSINFRIRLLIKEFSDMYIIRHEFIKKLHRRFQEEGIVIPFPQRTLHLEGFPKISEKT